MIKEEVLQELNKLKEEKYKDFSKRVTVTNMNVLGVRNPIINDIAKRLVKSGKYLEYIEITPDYFEEAYIIIACIQMQKDYDFFKKKIIEKYNLVDNWAICDMPFYTHHLKKNEDDYYNYIIDFYQKYKDKTFFARYVINVFRKAYGKKLNHYEEMFKIMEEADNMSHIGGEYYVKMDIAWALQEMYMNFPSETFDLIKKHNFTIETKKYAIRKVRDSFRQSELEKEKIKEIL